MLIRARLWLESYPMESRLKLSYPWLLLSDNISVIHAIIPLAWYIQRRYMHTDVCHPRRDVPH